jgi:5-methyltetrahydrofolate--homocysteine methyltransferase
LATAAAERGATFFILNPLDEIVMNSVNAAKVLFKGNISYLYKQSRVGFEKKTVVSKEDLIETIIYGDSKSSVEISKKLLDFGTPAQELIDKYVSKALNKVGDYYENGKFFIPDLLKAAEASQGVLTLVKKYLPKSKKKGKIVLATVKGDIHDIGKNIAGMIFESAGYEVVDLGKDVSCKKIIQEIKKHKPDAIGLSALLTTTMSEMENVISELRKEKLNVKVIIGGPNVSMDYAKKIGAFGAARNVIEGLRILKTIK